MLLARAALVLALLALVALAWALRRRRAAQAFEPRLARLPLEVVGAPAAPLAIYYFTSRFCIDCKDTPRVARDAAPELPAIPLPVEERGALARALGVPETPTLFLVDAEGRIRYARVGNPEPAELWTYVREAWDSLEAEGALGRVAA